MNAFFSAEVTFDLIANLVETLCVPLCVYSNSIVVWALVFDDCVDLRDVEIALEGLLVSQTLECFLRVER